MSYSRAIIFSIPGQLPGTIPVYTGTTWTGLQGGTSGQFLKTLGTGAPPVWVDLPVATSSQSGILSSAQYKDLTRTTSASQEPPTVQTKLAGTADMLLDELVVPENSFAIFTASIKSQSTTGNQWAAAVVKFAFRRETGDCIAVGDTAVLFQEADMGLVGVGIQAYAGVGAPNYLRFTGVAPYDIDHTAVVTMQLIPNPNAL